MTGYRAGSIMLAAAIAMPGAASAEWREARSKHFTVYSEAGEASVRDAATRLERLDRLMRVLTGNKASDSDQIANPLTVYVVDSLSAIARIYGSGSAGVGGFYVPRATGSVAFTPRVTGDDRFRPDIVLFHEYGHHFLLGNYAAAYPAWFAEGYSEYMSTTRFSDDKVEFGIPAQHRAYGLLQADGGLSVRQLFTMGDRKLSGIERESLYGRGWLLTHMVMHDPARAKQFDEYLRLLGTGQTSEAAADTAFGSITQLSTAATAYLRRNRFGISAMPISVLAIDPVTVRTLTPGEDRMMPYRLRSVRGVDERAAASVYKDGAKVAAAFPDDPVVQGWFAEMAYDAGHDDVADAAADRALAADPRSIQALLYKARVRLRVARNDKADAARWQEARGWILKANAIDNNNTGALSLYYDSFLMADETPRASAIAALHRALELAPQDPSLRWKAAGQWLRDDNAGMARVVLRPLAYNPHGGEANPASKLIALLDQGVTGKAAMEQIEAGKKAEEDESK